jgi:hypothetical protein
LGKVLSIKIQDLGMSNRDYVVSNWLVRRGKEQGKQQNIVEELQGLRRMLVYSYTLSAITPGALSSALNKV